MIIGHKYKYVFFELPKTGTTAIANELCELYSGERILKKHATFYDFQKYARPKEKSYFKFSCIRNPLDQTVSRYEKLRSGQQNPEKDIERYLKKNQNINIGTKRLLKQYNYINKHNADFKTYFLKFYKLPHLDWSLFHHKQFDFIIRFENLNEDFKTALNKLGITPVRNLPLLNKTKAKSKNNFFDYFHDSKQKKRAIFVFEPYFRYWNYEFPNKWNNKSMLSLIKGNYIIFNFLKKTSKLYWKYVRK
jgi:hypothetical protein